MTPEAVQDGPPGPTAHDPAGLTRPATVDSTDPLTDDPQRAGDVSEARPGYLAEKICEGFVRHDRRDREGAVAAFFEVDRHQFAHLDDEAAREAAEAFVDALWAKDDVERAYVDAVGPAGDAEAFDEAGLADADWSAVTAALARRAGIVGMDEEYATATTEAWRRHKTGGDYWTPTMVAQAHEVRAAIGDSETDREQAVKNRHGRSGFGHLPARYLVGVELHDMRTEEHWQQAAAVMTPYFAEIVAAHGEDR